MENISPVNKNEDHHEAVNDIDDVNQQKHGSGIDKYGGGIIGITGRSTDLKIVTSMGTEINFRFFNSKSSEWVYKQLF